MRVLSIIHYPDFGGPYNRNLRVIPILARRNVKTIVLTPNTEGDGKERLEAAGIETVQTELSRVRSSFDARLHAGYLASFWREVAKIRHIIRRLEIDVVQINGSINPQGAVAGHLEGAAVVWQLLDTTPPPMARAAVMPLVVSLSDVVMSTGLAVARVHPGALQMSHRLRFFIPPVDLDLFRPDDARRAAAREELGLSDETLLVGSVGNVNVQKGHEYLIQAMAPLARREPRVAIRILGRKLRTHESYIKRLERMARTGFLEGEGQFAIIEPGARVPKLLPAFDVFVLASVPRSEGIPTAALEAMACGIPVVVTDVGSVREVVTDGQTGFVVPPLEPDMIADAVGKLLQSLTLRRRMGDRGREVATKRFGASRCAASHLEAYEAARKYRKHRGGRRRVSSIAR